MILDHFTLMQGYPKALSFGSRFFFFNDLPDSFTFQIGSYACDIIIYSCLTSKSDMTKKNDIQSVVIWGKKWLVNMNASKMKCLSFSHQRELFCHPSAWLILISLRVILWDFLISFMFFTVMKWNSYIESTVTFATRKLVHSVVPDNSSCQCPWKIILTLPLPLTLTITLTLYLIFRL